jgi:hypothetical protein
MVRSQTTKPEPKARSLDGAELKRKIRRWAEVTELALVLRGAVLLGPGSRRRDCTRAALEELNRLREARTRG